MGLISTGRWKSLEQWSATLFLVAGGLLVVHAGIHVLIAFTGFSYPFHHEVPFGFLGMILGFVALLGLYPQLVTRSPKLAHAGAVLAAIGTVGWFAIGTRALVDDLGFTPPGWLDPIAPMVILGVILGYLAFGVAGLRTDVVSRTTAVAVLTPALVMVYNIASALVLPDFSGGAVIVASGFALAHLGIGAALQSEDFPTGPRASVTGIATD